MKDKRNEQSDIPTVSLGAHGIRLEDTNVWNYRDVPNALISGHVGTGKSVLLASVIRQLVARQTDLIVIDTKAVYLSELKQLTLLRDNVFSGFEGTIDGINKFYDSMISVRDKHLGAVVEPHFLVIDELSFFVEQGNRLSFADDKRENYEQALGRLTDIALMGHELGFNLIVSTVMPSLEFMPSILRNQLTLRVVMGVPSADVACMMFGDVVKNVRLSPHAKGFGIFKNGSDDVDVFSPLKLPTDFNLVDYVRQSLPTQESV
ncbi:FtsK/SpoIIIE domain-containing protein [Leuconostoc citreum]|uniref:FtsK/SpoIIIE domain-containing protein n=1 Tax=Leuconostoc citreum TaxID=33964 RepID=UPI0032E026CD